jgi:hypothetical protein
MVRKTKSPYDDYTARCPMLGHLAYISINKLYILEELFGGNWFLFY